MGFRFLRYLKFGSLREGFSYRGSSSFQYANSPNNQAIISSVGYTAITSGSMVNGFSSVGYINDQSGYMTPTTT